MTSASSSASRAESQPGKFFFGRVVIAVLVALTLPASDSLSWAEEWLLIQGGTLIDGTGAPPVPHAWILLRGDRIIKVGPAGSFKKPDGARILKARNRCILPGLIDAHVHLATSGVVSFSFVRPQSHTEEVFRRNLHSELLGGVTRVRDLSMPADLARELTAEVTRQPTLGARLTYSGPILTAPNGYGSPYAVEVATPEQGRTWVRDLVAQGATVIKIAVTSRDVDRSPVTPMEAQVAAAIVREAHARGVPVAAHVAGATREDLKTAVEAGVDSLEHMPGTWEPAGKTDALYTDSGLLPEILARHIILVPTLSVEVGESFGPSLEDLTEDPGLLLRLMPGQRRLLRMNLEDFAHNPGRQRVAEEGRARLGILLKEIAELHAAGVPLACGSDAGNGLTFHGNLAREIELLHEGGLSPLEAIRSGTQVSARLLGVEAGEGTVEEGKLADLLLVRGDPLEDLRVLRDVDRVVIAGRVVEVGKMVRTAEKELGR